MALPGNLVKLIHDGTAQYKTYAWGYSTHGFLPVRNDTYIVIVGFQFWHFLDLDFGDLEDLDEVFTRSVKQIRFRSRKSNNHFVIRQPIRSISIGDGFNDIFDTWGHTEFNDLYLLHEENVSIEVINSPQAINTGIASDQAPSKAVSKSPPAGFGTNVSAIPISAAVDVFIGDGTDPGTMEIVPLSRQFNDLLAFPPFGFSQLSGQIEYPVTPFSGSQSILSGEGREHRSMPMLNIFYIEIDKEPTEKLKSSF